MVSEEPSNTEEFFDSKNSYTKSEFEEKKEKPEIIRSSLSMKENVRSSMS